VGTKALANTDTIDKAWGFLVQTAVELIPYFMSVAGLLRDSTPEELEHCQPRVRLNRRVTTHTYNAFADAGVEPAMPKLDNYCTLSCLSLL
jgi:hypothetical protein